MRKFTITILAMLCLLTTSLTAYAADTALRTENQLDESLIAESRIDEVLEAKGFPANVLSELDITTKERFEERFASDEDIVYGDEQTYYFNVDEDGNLVPAIMTRGQIPSAQLKLSGIYANGVKNGNVTTVYYTFRYQWLILPFQRWQDPIGIVYNPDLLRFRIGSFEKRDNYVMDGKTYSKPPEKTCAEYNSDGFGWYADLTGHQSTPSALSGVADFQLEPKPGTTIKSGTGWTSRMYGKYAHTKANVSADFSFSYKNAGGGISFGLPSENDTQGFIFDIKF